MTATSETSNEQEAEISPRPSKTTVRNRRLTYLNRSYYFSSPEIQERLFPVLYEKLVLRHKSRSERIDEERASKSRTLTNVLLDAGDHVEKLQRQRDRTDEERSRDEARQEQERGIAEMTSKEVLADRDKSMELLERMVREKFLAGEDDEFDYSTVDENSDWDDWETLEEDFRAKYFDQESPESEEEGKGLTGETGVQDF